MAALDDLAAAIGPLRLPREYVPLDPSLKQEHFLRQHKIEGLFGGAAGPGKTTAMLMAGLQYVDVPGYDAVILRTTLHDHEKAKALIPVSHEWLGATRAWWNGTLRQWRFPGGGSLSFGYLRTVADMTHWKGTAYQFVGFEELTEFDQSAYMAISRVIRDAPEMGDGVRVPLRKWSTSNPGGPGHGWVREKFVDPATRDPDVFFVKATIHDNPRQGFYEEYLETLAHLSPVDRMRLLDGDWDVLEEGGKFKRGHFPLLEGGIAAAQVVRAVRYWDLAGTEPSPANLDPDYTAGILLGVDAQGMYTILDIVHVRVADNEVETIVRNTAFLDRDDLLPGVPVTTFIEQDPGQAGKAQVRYYQRKVLQGFDVRAGDTRIRGVNAAKQIRAAPAAAAAANGLYRMVASRHRADFLGEVALFPQGPHDDLVDALSGAHNKLSGAPVRTTAPRVSLPPGRLPVGSDRTGVRLPGRVS